MRAFLTTVLVANGAVGVADIIDLFRLGGPRLRAQISAIRATIASVFSLWAALLLCGVLK